MVKKFAISIFKGYNINIKTGKLQFEQFKDWMLKHKQLYDDYYKGGISDHFDGEKFFNPWNPRPKKGLWDVFKWRMTGERADCPGGWPHEIAHPLGDARRDG